MVDILAHVTQLEVPGYLLAALAGFAAGVAVTYGALVRKIK